MRDRPTNSRPLNIVHEFHVHETIRDACFLHNESLFAVAQKKHLFVYDRDGVELHCLRQVLGIWGGYRELRGLQSMFTLVRPCELVSLLFF